MKFTITVTIKLPEFLEPVVYAKAGELKIGRLDWTIQRDERRVFVIAAYRDLCKYDGKLILCQLKELSEMTGVLISNIVIAVENNGLANALRTLSLIPLQKAPLRSIPEQTEDVVCRPVLH